MVNLFLKQYREPLSKKISFSCLEIKKGITIRAYTENNEIVSKACVEIHNKFPTFGCYNIQLILDNKNNVLPFEINPRISTTICLVLASGVDPINLFLAEPKEISHHIKKSKITKKLE